VALPGAVGPVAAAAASPEEPLPVAGVTARAAPAARSAALRAFYDRARRGTGRFVTREDIERLNPFKLSDVLRGIPGVQVIPDGRGEQVRMAGSRGPLVGQSREPEVPGIGGVRPVNGEGVDCPVLYFVDGTPHTLSAREYISELVAPSSVEGIEIYPRASEVPVQYQQRGHECGVILIWTRERA
jgi:TonB-dependent Receptor Plug Domain